MAVPNMSSMVEPKPVVTANLTPLCHVYPRCHRVLLCLYNPSLPIDILPNYIYIYIYIYIYDRVLQSTGYTKYYQRYTTCLRHVKPPLGNANFCLSFVPFIRYSLEPDVLMVMHQLLSSTFSATSWNLIFSEQDGFGVVTGCVGWCLEKNKSPKVCFQKCKLILPKIQSIEFRSFLICCCPRVALQNYTNG